MLDSLLLDKLRSGCVIPAHPLALHQDNSIDERRQRALTRYYLASGAGGLAVGVHTTQFAIHEPQVGLYRPVLELAMETARKAEARKDWDKPIMIAGILGNTEQAVREASLARELGYHIGLLSLTALRGKSVDEMVDHCREVAEVMPVMGFYLQETISRMVLGADFWQKFFAIPNVCAVKIAPFNRYQTLDVLEAVAHSGRSEEIALYTGNDDNIILDLLTKFDFRAGGKTVQLRIVGGLLGQWACWTKKAVEHLERIKAIWENRENVPHDLITLASQLTLANREIFDAENHFPGCIPGISCVLKCQGLLNNTGTLDPNERLSSGQADKIDRIVRNYPHLTDDEFVKANLDKWLAP